MESVLNYRHKPTSDVVFKRVFARNENLDITAGLIRDFFDYDVEASDIKLISPESVTPETYFNLDPDAQAKMATTRRDVTVEITPAKVTIEMQAYKDKQFITRAVFYLTTAFANQHATRTNGTHNFSDFKQVWGLNILARNEFDDNQSFRTIPFEIPGAPTGVANEPLKISFFEINKQLKQQPPNSDTAEYRRWQWAYFFKTGVAHDDAPEYIKKAASIIYLVNTNVKEAAMLTSEEYGRADLLTFGEERGIDKGIKIGKAEGIEIGEARMALRAIKTALANNQGIELGATMVGLTVEQAQRLLDSESQFA